MKRSKNTDPAHDVLRYERQPLDAIFRPETVAVIGATDRPGSVGRTIVWNLISNPFGGTVYPVNKGRQNVLGIQAYPTISDVPAAVDLAVVVAPAPAVPGIIAECVEAGVEGAIIISAGFKETGAEGAELEEQVLEEARRGRMRIIGPNCLGVMNPTTGLNATFAGDMARPGNVGFLSQSGALMTAILDRSFRENVGFSAFVSVGSMMDVGWGDLIYYLGDDPKTESIVVYMESIGDARSFLSAAREVALTKPIIVIKAGRTAAASQAAASHTGSLTGSDEVLDAAFRRSGVLRIDAISDLFDMAEVLSKQPRPKGPRLTILTNAGGPAVLATDALIGGGGAARGDLPEHDGGAQRDPPRPLEPRQPHRHPRRRRPRALRAGAPDRRRRPRERRPARRPHPPGHDRPDGDGRATRPLRHRARQARARQLDGRRGGRGRRLRPQRRRHTHLRLPRHRRAPLQRHVALHGQPARASTRPRSSPTSRRGPRAGRGDHRRRP